MKEAKQGIHPLTVEEYIQLELQSERRHEYVNGQLIELPGEKPSITALPVLSTFSFLQN